MRKSMMVAGLATALGAAVTLLPGCKASNKEAAPPAATAGTTTPAEPPKEQDVEALHAAASKPKELDEHTKQVFAYPLTWKKLEAYAAALKEIRVAGEKDKALMNQLREPAPPNETPPEMAKRVEGIGPIKGILARHGLVGMDLLLVPRAVLSARNAYASEKAGKPMQPTQTSASGLELLRADHTRMEKLFDQFMADQRALSGR